MQFVWLLLIIILQESVHSSRLLDKESELEERVDVLMKTMNLSNHFLNILCFIFEINHVYDKWTFRMLSKHVVSESEEESNELFKFLVYSIESLLSQLFACLDER
jgi:hypothetical protein